MTVRKAGEPLAGQFVSSLRKRAGLTQDQFAEALGVRGGKSVVSGWETGATPCEGPVAELIRLKFGGVSASAEALYATMDRIWLAGPTPGEMWRQISVVPHDGMKLEASAFVNLLPDAALTHKQYVHGFPFVAETLPPDVFGLTTEGWIGRIPNVQSKSPRYLWTLTRDGAFAYREAAWEENQIVGGHFHIRPVLALACATVGFMPKLAKKAGWPDTKALDLSFEFGGMRGKSIVVPIGVPSYYVGSDDPKNVWADDYLRAEVKTTVGEMRQDLIGVALKLVKESVFLLRPDLAQGNRLANLLSQFHAEDKKVTHRQFGVLDK